MKAILLPEAGGVENLRFQEIEMPGVARGEVLVEVRAVSVNPADVKIRASEDLLTAFLGPDRSARLDGVLYFQIPCHELSPKRRVSMSMAKATKCSPARVEPSRS